MQLQLLSGIATDNGPDVRVALPVNRVPVPGSNGVSNGYLRPAEGIVQVVVGPGDGRGLFVWDGVLYAVMGTSFISIAGDGTIVTLGTVAAGGPVSWTFDFTRLAFSAGGKLYFWDKSTLREVTDPDLGVSLSVVWIQGYFFSTDGEFIVASDLLDPASIGPFSYASSETSPDAVVSLLRVRNELWALNRYTCEVFTNTAQPNFPFSVILGAQVQKGCVGANACCVFLEQVAFVGSAQNEATGIYLANNGRAQKISTIEVDRLLADLNDDKQSRIILETRNDGGLAHLYVRLPDRTLVFDAAATAAFERPVWFALTSGNVGFSAYRGAFFQWFENRWWCCDPTAGSMRVGYLDQTISTQWGDAARWEVSTPILFNEGRGVIVNELSLTALTGRVALGSAPVISTSHSLDGVSWSQDITKSAGVIGDRQHRIRWLRLGKFDQMVMQRFRGSSDAHISLLRLDADVVGLSQ